MTFSDFFQTGKGNTPYDYQSHLAGNNPGTACRSQLTNIPTGLGKTAAVVLAWLWNRVQLQNPNWPRRLVYCLPIRMLLGQTEGEVKKWPTVHELVWDGKPENRSGKIGVHVLMGGEDAGEWDIYPKENAILMGTGELQSASWNLPLSALYVDYIRPEDALTPATKPRPRQSKPLPTVAGCAVVSAVAPSIAQAVSIADRVHDALCKWSDQRKGRATEFTGLGGDGKPRTDHSHHHIFCQANSLRDAITHITIWATMGFDEAGCLALGKLNKVWGHGRRDIRLVLHGIGQSSDFKDCVLFGKARIWRSFMPLVSTRRAKTFRDGRPKMGASGWQVGSGTHGLLRLLALHPQGAAATIKRCDERERPFQFGNRHLRSLQFQTIRHGGGGNRGNSSGNAFVITFPEPVCGPLASGYGSHFSLGLFQPIMSSGAAQLDQRDSDAPIRNSMQL